MVFIYDFIQHILRYSAKYVVAHFDFTSKIQRQNVFFSEDRPSILYNLIC